MCGAPTKKEEGGGLKSETPDRSFTDGAFGIVVSRKMALHTHATFSDRRCFGACNVLDHISTIRHRVTPTVGVGKISSCP